MPHGNTCKARGAFASSTNVRFTIGSSIPTRPITGAPSDRSSSLGLRTATATGVPTDRSLSERRRTAGRRWFWILPGHCQLGEFSSRATPQQFPCKKRTRPIRGAFFLSVSSCFGSFLLYGHVDIERQVELVRTAVDQQAVVRCRPASRNDAVGAAGSGRGDAFVAHLLRGNLNRVCA